MKKKNFIYFIVAMLIVSGIGLSALNKRKLEKTTGYQIENLEKDKTERNKFVASSRGKEIKIRYIGEALNTIERDGQIKIYENNNKEAQVIAVIKDYEKVELLETLPYGWFKVKLKDGQIGYADACYIRAKKIPFHGYDENSSEWVLKFNQNEQTLKIYRKGKLILQSIASGGVEDSFTPKGIFLIEENRRGEWAYIPRFEQGMKYWVGFKDSYLFHSVPYTKDKQIIEEEAKKLGKPSSHGCIRLPLDISKFIYDEVPDGALVIID